MTVSMLPQALGILLARTAGAGPGLYVCRAAGKPCGLCGAVLAGAEKLQALPAGLSGVHAAAAEPLYGGVGELRRHPAGLYYLVASFYCKDEITGRDIGWFCLPL